MNSELELYGATHLMKFETGIYINGAIEKSIAFFIGLMIVESCALNIENLKKPRHKEMFKIQRTMFGLIKMLLVLETHSELSIQNSFSSFF